MTGEDSNDKFRLLIADDDEGVLYLLADCLRREKYEIVEFSSGAAVFDWLQTNEADLLVLDLKLGDLPAPDLINLLRQQGRDFPFIVVTGHGDERSAVEVMKQGALDYVMKDVGMLDLLPGIVRRALRIIQRERKLEEANALIRQREERLQKVIQTAFDGFVRFDSRGNFLEANSAFCEMVGYTREELLANNASILEPGLDHIRERIEELRRTGTEHCFITFKRRDGRQYEVEMSVRPDGEDYIGFIHDLTEIRRLERMTLRITQDERRRIGSELHDGLGQQLTAIGLMSHSLARALEEIAPAQANAAAKITKYVQDAVTLTRQLAHGLAPIAEEAGGLLIALTNLASMTTAAGVLCEFAADPKINAPDPAIAGHLYRIAQEAINNSLKHGKPRSIHIRLEERNGHLDLTIQDDGHGLPKTRSRKPGMGLKLIQHRARLIGGQIAVHSEPGCGVQIVCSLPKQS